MDWYVRNFIKASLVWLALGVTLGVGMAAVPAWIVYRAAHLHMNLLGFVTMMIYGVAYHVIPRFSGNPLHSPRLATWHWWISNAGLFAMVIGFLVRPHYGSLATPVLAGGGILAAIGAYVFVYGIWRTVDGQAALRAMQAHERSSRSSRLPVAG